MRILPIWLRRVLRLGIPTHGPAFPQDSELLTFFTNVDQLVGYFSKQLEGQGDGKRLLVVHGVGGIGKSSLLSKLRSSAAHRGVPVAFASGQTAATPLQAFREFDQTMRACGSPCTALKRALAKYAEVQAKVTKERSKFPEALLTGGGMAAGTAAGANPALGAAAGRTLAVGVDWLRSVSSKPDAEMFLDPTRMLTEAFVDDLSRISRGQRCVVMLDTYEKMAGMDPWALGLVLKIRDLAFVVIAGRDTPSWEREWPGWMHEACIEELRPMGPDTMRLLIQRYSLSIRGAELPGPAVDSIVAFARGLPLVATTAVALSVKFNVTRFATVRPRVVADLVDRVMEGVPADARPWLEVAAILRWFSRPLLKEIVGRDLDDTTYSVLTHFPFVRPHESNLMIHDAIREAVDENCLIQDPARHAEIHDNAASYFRRKAHDSAGDDRLSYTREWIFHVISGNPTAGPKVLREVCDDIASAGLLRDLRAVLSDVGAIANLGTQTKLWHSYYSARALLLEGDTEAAERAFRVVCDAPECDERLTRYAHCGLAEIVTRYNRLGDKEARARALRIAHTALASGILDSYLVNAHFRIARVRMVEGDWPGAAASIEEARQWFDANNDLVGVIRSQNELQSLEVLRGDWRRFLAAHDTAVGLLSHRPNDPYLNARTRGYWAWGLVLTGQCSRAEAQARESAAIAQKQEDLPSRCVYARNLGWALVGQGKYDDGIASLSESVKIAEGLGAGFREVAATSNAILGMALARQGSYDEARERLDEALRVKEEVGDHLGMPDTLAWRGLLAAERKDYQEAVREYKRSLEWSWIGRRYCESEARLGLCHALYAQGQYSELSANLIEAEAVAADYHDHAAWLNVLKGDLMHLNDAADRDGALRAYLVALAHGLLHNRFVFDQVAGAVVQACRHDATNGSWLANALEIQWQRESTDVTGRAPLYRAITSPIALAALERIVRQDEGGSQLRQTTLLECLRASYVP